MTDMTSPEKVPTGRVDTAAARSTRGTPAHPPFAHVTVGAYTTAFVMDVLSFVRPFGEDTSRDMFHAGTFAFIVGNVALLLTVISGFVDRAQRTAEGSRARTSAGKHALLGILLGVVAIADTTIRQQVLPAGTTHTPPVVLVLSVIVAVLLFITGRMGGRMVFVAGVGGPGGRGN